MKPSVIILAILSSFFMPTSQHSRAQSAPSSSVTPPTERIPTKQIEAGPIRHTELTPGQIARLQKRDAYGLLIVRSGSTDEDALRDYHRETLTVDGAKQVLSCYHEEPVPIQMYPKK